MSSTTERTAAGDMTEDRLSPVFEDGVRRIFSSYTVDMTRPEAATAGGPHTLQRIRLLTSHRTPLLLGWANASQRRAQLHTLGHTLALSKLRLGRELVMPPLEYVRFLEAATGILEAEGMTVEVVAFVKEGIDSGVRPRVSPPNRSITLPYYVVDAMTAVSTLASRMAESAAPVRHAGAVETIGAPHASSATGWSTVLRWAPSVGVGAAAAKRRSSG